MTATVLNGKEIAAEVRVQVAREAAAYAEQSGRPPGLEVVLVGEDPASQVYVRNKEKAAAKVGIRGAVHRLPATTSQRELEDVVRRLNEDDAVDGILVQLPLPSGLDPQPVLDRIDPAKDVDGLHPVNAGYLAVGREGLKPCTPSGCMEILRVAGVGVEGAHAVVIGRSNLVGKPLGQMLLARNATVTMAHSRTRDLGALCRTADILVAAAGRAGLVQGDWVKPGAVVLDVGTNRSADGGLVGDVDFNAAKERAGYITPVPGGVGPMTIALLLSNTVQAARSRAEH